MLALSVEVQELPTDPLKRADRHGVAVHPRYAATVSADLTAEDQHIVFRNSKLAQQIGQIAGRGHVEDPFDAGFGRVGTNDVGAQTITEETADGIDHDRLSGSGFTGQRHEPGTELDL